MIRTASPKDFPDILEIKKQYALNISEISNPEYRKSAEKSGFLLPGDYTKEEMQELINEIFLVDEEYGKVVAYFSIISKQELNPKSEREWLIPELKDVYFSSPHGEIWGMAVSEEFGNRGIAKKLLERGLAEVKNWGASYLFSFVVYKPISNLASIRFHERNGFQRAAIRQPSPFMGIDNYQSIVYARKI